MAFFLVQSPHITHISSKLTLNSMVLLTSKTVDIGQQDQATQKNCIKTSLQRAKVAVWCGVSKMGIVGSFLLKKKAMP